MATRERKSAKEAPSIKAPKAEGKAASTAARERISAHEVPDLEPPSAREGSPASLEGPSERPEALLRESTDVAGAVPTLAPPTEAEIEAAEEVGIAAWHTGKKITALWSNDANRNSYIAVPGLGWKKLANTNDSSVVAMTMLAAHAEQTYATVNIRTEADGMVHEIYVW